MGKVIGSAALYSMLALLAGGAVHAGLTVNDTLNTYQLYGKDSVTIYGNAETSPGGSVGSDKLVHFTNNGVKVGGSLTSGKDITTQADVDVGGFLNARNNLYFMNTSNSVALWTNVGGSF